MLRRNERGSTLSVPLNQMSGTVSAGLSEILHQVEEKLDSAQRRFNPQFNKGPRVLDAEVDTFDIDFEKEVREQEKNLLKRASTSRGRKPSAQAMKTPSTMERTNYNKSGSFNKTGGEGAQTPEQFKATVTVAGVATDDQGNRCSILPGSSRPSKVRAAGDSCKVIAGFEEGKLQALPVEKKTGLELLKAQNAAIKPLKEGELPKQRTNFVRLNTKMNYKPRIRGAAF